jgi:hypothetical protein
MGPALVTADEVPDVQDLAIRTITGLITAADDGGLITDGAQEVLRQLGRLS